MGDSSRGARSCKPPSNSRSARRRSARRSAGLSEGSKHLHAGNVLARCSTPRRRGLAFALTFRLAKALGGADLCRRSAIGENAPNGHRQHPQARGGPPRTDNFAQRWHTGADPRPEGPRGARLAQARPTRAGKTGRARSFAAGKTPNDGRCARRFRVSGGSPHPMGRSSGYDRPCAGRSSAVIIATLIAQASTMPR